MNIRYALIVLLSILAGLLFFLPVQAQAPSAPQVQSQPQATAGKLERITVHGPSLVGNLEGDSPDRMVSVYLPPGYAKNPKRRYPVLYLLHGYTDSDERWYGLRGPHFVNVPKAADRAFANGVKEMILVTPNAFTRYQGSMYSNSATIGNWEAFVAEDLVAYMDKNYRTLANRASRGLAGHSMGGYGTMRIGMKYPHVFSSLYAMNPCCMFPAMEPDVKEIEAAAKVKTAEEVAAADFITKAMLASAAAWSPNPRNAPLYFDLPVANGKPVPEVVAKWVANAPLVLIHQYIPNLRKYQAIAFDAGDKDFGDIPVAVKSLDRILTDYGIAHTSEVYDGDHVNRVEQRLETKVLPFFSEHLKLN